MNKLKRVASMDTKSEKSTSKKVCLEKCKRTRVLSAQNLNTNSTKIVKKINKTFDHSDQTDNKNLKTDRINNATNTPKLQEVIIIDDDDDEADNKTSKNILNEHDINLKCIDLNNKSSESHNSNATKCFDNSYNSKKSSESELKNVEKHSLGKKNSQLCNEKVANDNGKIKVNKLRKNSGKSAKNNKDENEPQKYTHDTYFKDINNEIDNTNNIQFEPTINNSETLIRINKQETKTDDNHKIPRKNPNIANSVHTNKTPTPKAIKSTMVNLKTNYTKQHMGNNLCATQVTQQLTLIDEKVERIITKISQETSLDPSVENNIANAITITNDTINTVNTKDNLTVGSTINEKKISPLNNTNNNNKIIDNYANEKITSITSTTNNLYTDLPLVTNEQDSSQLNASKNTIQNHTLQKKADSPIIDHTFKNNSIKKHLASHENDDNNKNSKISSDSSQIINKINPHPNENNEYNNNNNTKDLNIDSNNDKNVDIRDDENNDIICTIDTNHMNTETNLTNDTNAVKETQPNRKIIDEVVYNKDSALCNKTSSNNNINDEVNTNNTIDMSVKVTTIHLNNTKHPTNIATHLDNNITNPNHNTKHLDNTTNKKATDLNNFATAPNNTMIHENKKNENKNNANKTYNSSPTTNEIYTEKCIVCNDDIGHLNEQSRHQHIIQCLDKKEEEEKVEKEVQKWKKAQKKLVMNCPLCGKSCKTFRSRQIHIKKCSIELNVLPSDVIRLVTQQEKERDEKLKADVKNQRILFASMERIKRNKASIYETFRKKTPKVKKRMRCTEPVNKFEEDTQLALALSTSLTEDQTLQNIQPHNQPTSSVTSIYFNKDNCNNQRGRKGRRGRKNAQPTVPPLTVISIEDSLMLVKDRFTRFLEEWYNQKMVGDGGGSLCFMASEMPSKYPSKLKSLWEMNGLEEVKEKDLLLKRLFTLQQDGKVVWSGESCAGKASYMTDNDIDNNNDFNNNRTAMNTQFLLNHLSDEDETRHKFYDNGETHWGNNGDGLQKLSTDFSSMFNNQLLSDITFVLDDVGVSHDGRDEGNSGIDNKNKLLYGHKLVLACRCSKLYQLVAEKNTYTIKDWDSNSFSNFILYLYTAHLPTNHIEGVLPLARSFGLEDLVENLLSHESKKDSMNDLYESQLGRDNQSGDDDENEEEEGFDNDDINQVQAFFQSQKILKKKGQNCVDHVNKFKGSLSNDIDDVDGIYNDNNDDNINESNSDNSNTTNNVSNNLTTNSANENTINNPKINDNEEGCISNISPEDNAIEVDCMVSNEVNSACEVKPLNDDNDAGGNGDGNNVGYDGGGHDNDSKNNLNRASVVNLSSASKDNNSFYKGLMEDKHKNSTVDNADNPQSPNASSINASGIFINSLCDDGDRGDEKLIKVEDTSHLANEENEKIMDLTSLNEFDTSFYANDNLGKTSMVITGSNEMIKNTKISRSARGSLGSVDLKPSESGESGGSTEAEILPGGMKMDLDKNNDLVVQASQLPQSGCFKSHDGELRNSNMLSDGVNQQDVYSFKEDLNNSSLKNLTKITNDVSKTIATPDSLMKIQLTQTNKFLSPSKTISKSQPSQHSIKEASTPKQKIQINISNSMKTPTNHPTTSTPGFRVPTTPKLNYNHMQTPTLVRHCDYYGIKPLSRPKMIKLLKNIYYTLHPGVARTPLVDKKQAKNKKKQATLVDKKNSKNVKTSKITNIDKQVNNNKNVNHKNNNKKENHKNNQKNKDESINEFSKDFEILDHKSGEGGQTPTDPNPIKNAVTTTKITAAYDDDSSMRNNNSTTNNNNNDINNDDDVYNDFLYCLSQSSSFKNDHSSNIISSDGVSPFHHGLESHDALNDDGGDIDCNDEGSSGVCDDSDDGGDKDDDGYNGTFASQRTSSSNASDSLVFMSQPLKKVKMQPHEVKKHLLKYMRSDEVRWLKVLHYEPFELAELYADVKDKLPCRISKDALMDFLDEMNVLFTTRAQNKQHAGRRG